MRPCVRRNLGTMLNRFLVLCVLALSASTAGATRSDDLLQEGVAMLELSQACPQLASPAGTDSIYLLSYPIMMQPVALEHKLL